MRHISPLLVLSLLFAAGCDCSGDTFDECTDDDGCEASEQCLDGTCEPRPDAGGMDGGASADGGARDAGAGCTTDDECAGGVCLEGACCADVDAVCGDVCCAAAETCFANSCVVPGAPCVSNADCAGGQYCERGLDDGADPVDAGMPDGGSATCLSAPGRGRCLALPPSCDAVPAGAPCILSTCEFRPAVGMLDAVVQWRWGPDEAVELPDRVDVWSTPVVGRIHDTNCDGRVDELDPSAIVFVSNDTRSGACHSIDSCRVGVLRALDGQTGRELWSLAAVDDTSAGFTGVSAALGDLDDDGRMDIVAMTAEGQLAAIAGDGSVMGVGSDTLPSTTITGLGWGGGLALADMNGDGDPEVAWRGAVYTWAAGTFTRVFDTPSTRGGWPHATVSTSTSFFVNLDDDEDLELLSGYTALDTDGSVLWRRDDLADGFAAVGDFDINGTPEVVLVYSGQIVLLNATTGETLAGPVRLMGSGAGGPPTIADFDGDDEPEIGVAQANVYSMVEVDLVAGSFETAWTTTNHDNSSSVTGSTVFDFEGDGIAEVIYNDECFLWVYDGPTGDVRFSAPTNSFTGTEASLVADVDGDGHAEMVMISTGADDRWHCQHHAVGDDTYPAWTGPSYGPSWRGISVFRDRSNGWVGTRSLWTQHAYHVTNTCDDRDGACDPAAGYGAIPTRQRANWTVPWLNNFRQNVQDEGIFDAPDATITLRVRCTMPVELIAAVRNIGRSVLPAGVQVGFFEVSSGTETMLGVASTPSPIFPGGALEVELIADPSVPTTSSFVARIIVDPTMPEFRECDGTNNDSDEVQPRCLE